MMYTLSQSQINHVSAAGSYVLIEPTYSAIVVTGDSVFETETATFSTNSICQGDACISVKDGDVFGSNGNYIFCIATADGMAYAMNR